MGWFSNLFSSSASTVDSRRNLAMTTHDAFSLPTSSPTFPTHPHSFARDGANTPEAESTPGPTYAYPPPSRSPAYDYVPTTAGQASTRARPTSLLPLHSNTPLSPRPSYPPPAQTWARLRNWLSNEYPELGDTLNWGILPQDLADVELAFGFGLPSAVRESYLAVDGQEAESSAGCSEGLFFGLTLLPLEDVVEEWRFWREVDEDPATGGNEKLKQIMQSIPPGWVRKEYSQRGWIPLITDKAGNYLGVDLNPSEGGAVGQVIVFGRDFDTKVVMWRGDGSGGWAKWLASFVEELEGGEGFELGATNDGSEDSEDGVGFESYFFDGSGNAKGEGGGDAGTGGLRLTGEYRGWSVLEAWADRSMKRWKEAGLLPDPPSPPVQETQKLGLGVFDLTDSRSGSGAEVPIPVVSNLPQQTSALANVTNTVSEASRPPPPTISVTKPPAPLPVDLPSPSDIITPSSPTPSFTIDLEHGLMSPEAERPPSNASGSTELPLSTIVHETPLVKEATLVPLPLSDDGPSPQAEVTTSPLATVPSESVPDLLHTDPPDAVKIAPIEPALPVSPAEQTAPLPTSEPPPGNPVPVPEVGEQMADPDETIRLVGGGGTSGVVDDASLDSPLADAPKEREPDLAELASVTSVTSNESAAKTGGKHEKHEKKKSLSSGLKKLGKIGSGRKKTDL